jgi:hypothetical protein
MYKIRLFSFLLLIIVKSVFAQDWLVNKDILTDQQKKESLAQLDVFKLNKHYHQLQTSELYAEVIHKLKQGSSIEVQLFNNFKVIKHYIPQLFQAIFVTALNDYPSCENTPTKALMSHPITDYQNIISHNANQTASNPLFSYLTQQYESHKYHKFYQNIEDAKLGLSTAMIALIMSQSCHKLSSSKEKNHEEK